MRTTIEMKPEHRARLLDLAARRGQKGFSQLVTEALEAYLAAEAGRAQTRKRALLLRGSLPARHARRLRSVTRAIRASWR